MPSKSPDSDSRDLLESAQDPKAELIKSSNEFKEALRHFNTKNQQYILDRANERENESLLRAAKLKTDIDNFMKLHATTDRQGNQMSPADRLIMECDDALNSDAMAYHDWRSAMMGLIKLSKSLQLSLYVFFGANVGLPLKNFLYENIILRIQNKIEDHVINKNCFDATKMLKNISCDAQGKIHFKDLSNKEEDIAANRAHQCLFDIWLQTHDDDEAYSLKPDGFIYNSKNEKLDQKQVQTLLKSESLAKSFKEIFERKAAPSPALTTDPEESGPAAPRARM